MGDAVPHVPVTSPQDTVPEPELYRAVFDSLGDGILVGTWPGRVIVDLNPAYERILGYAREELVGQSTRVLHVDDERYRLFGEHVARELGEGRPVGVEWPMRRKDGTVIPCFLSFTPVVHPQRGMVAAVCICRDLSAQKRQDEALRESEARYRFLAENVSDVIARTLPDGTVSYVSPAIERVLGYRPDELVGRRGVELLHPDDAARVAAGPPLDVPATGLVVTHRYRHKDGHYVWLESANVAVRDAAGEVQEILSTARDVTERQRAISALEESHQRFHLIARATNDVVWDWDLLTDRVWWNEQYHRQFGYAPDETPPSSASWTDLIHPEDRARVVDSIHAAIEGSGDDWDAEYRFRLKDGAYAYVLDRGHVVRDAAGRAVRMVGSMLDLTERRRTEDALKESLERFELVSTATDEVPWDWDVVTNRTWWSANFGRIFGDTPGGLDFDAWAQRIHPEDRERILRGLRAVVASGSSWREEYRFRRADGSYAIVYDRGRVVPDAEGRARRMVGSIMDITERKRFERELAEQRDHYEALLRAQSDLGDGIVVLEGCRVAWANEAYARLVGRSVEELTRGAFDLRHVLPPADAPAHDRRGEDAGQEHYEARLLRADGSLLDVEVAVKAIGSGPDARRVAVVRDVSTRKASEQELEATRKQLAQSEKLTALGSLVSGVAHEIRTPLAYLSNNVNLIRLRLPRAMAAGDGRLVESVLEQAASAEEAVDRINRLVEDLRKFTRLRVGDARPGDLSRAAREAAELFRATHVGQVAVEADLAPAPLVQMDRVRVQQVVLNLLENALDARPADGRVVVRTGTTQEGGAFLEVEDRGVGIPPDVRGRLFDPFFTTKPNGTGLGLSIVKRIVDEHGATITLDSAPGQGTRVRVAFPPVRAG